jgi:hypothetical protein
VEIDRNGTDATRPAELESYWINEQNVKSVSSHGLKYELVSKEEKGVLCYMRANQCLFELV